MNSIDSASVNKDFESIWKKIKELTMSIDAKVDIDLFDNEISSLRALIGEIDNEEKNKIPKISNIPQANSANQLNSKEVGKVRDILEKFP